MTNDTRSLSPLSPPDYEAIEQAVMETARGRWFLREYAARNRTADTTQLLEAIARLEGAVSGERAMEQVERVRFDLLEMAKSIAGLKVELDLHEHGQEGSRFHDATNALDGIVRTTEQATSNILGAAEAIQEIAWSLREAQHDEAVCDRIDRLATEIYTSCTFQDLTAQRTQKVVRTLRFLEGRINALVDAWTSKDGTAGRQPAPAERSTDGSAEDALAPFGPPELTQTDVDSVIVDADFTVGPEPSSDIPPNVEAALAMQERASGLRAAGYSAEPTDAPVPYHSDESGADAASFEPAAAGLPRVLPPADVDLMAGDEQQFIIDDLDLLDVDFVGDDPGLYVEPPEPLEDDLDRSLRAATRAMDIGLAEAPEDTGFDDIGFEDEPAGAAGVQPMAMLREGHGADILRSPQQGLDQAPALAEPESGLQAGPSLAQIDAMNAAAKARIFG